MKITNIHTEEGEVWINFDQPIVMTEDGDFTVISVRGPHAWWKFSTSEKPRSIVKRASTEMHLASPGWKSALRRVDQDG